MFSMAHFLGLSLVEQSFVKAWKRYQSNEASILKPKIKDVKVLPNFTEKDQDGGHKINKLLVSFVRDTINLQYQQINT